MPTNGFVEIIKAVGNEPLGFYSLVFLILGSICYKLVSKVRRPKPLDIAVLLAIILVGFSGVALAVIRAENKVSSQKEDRQKPPSYTVLLKFAGERSSMVPAQIPFKNSSGQLNFGCGETKSTTVSWNVPAGADQINASAVWENTDNVKGQDQHVDVGITTTATGSITGRDRDWLGNCPGGGHGELVVQGTYRILQPSQSRPFESLQSGSVSVATPYILPLPVEQDLRISMVEATVIPDGSAPIVLRAAPVPAKGSSTTIIKQDGKIELVVSGSTAKITLQE